MIRFTFRKWLTFTNLKERYKMCLRLSLSEPISLFSAIQFWTPCSQGRQELLTITVLCMIYGGHVYLPTDGTQEEIHYEKSANQNKRNKI